MPDDTNPSPEAEALARVMWSEQDTPTRWTAAVEIRT